MHCLIVLTVVQKNASNQYYLHEKCHILSVNVMSLWKSISQHLKNSIHTKTRLGLGPNQMKRKSICIDDFSVTLQEIRDFDTKVKNEFV